MTVAHSLTHSPHKHRNLQSNGASQIHRNLQITVCIIHRNMQSLGGIFADFWTLVHSAVRSFVFVALSVFGCSFCQQSRTSVVSLSLYPPVVVVVVVVCGAVAVVVSSPSSCRRRCSVVAVVASSPLPCHRRCSAVVAVVVVVALHCIVLSCCFLLLNRRRRVDLSCGGCDDSDSKLRRKPDEGADANAAETPKEEENLQAQANTVTLIQTSARRTEDEVQEEKSVSVCRSQACHRSIGPDPDGSTVLQTEGFPTQLYCSLDWQQLRLRCGGACCGRSLSTATCLNTMSSINDSAKSKCPSQQPKDITNVLPPDHRPEDMIRHHAHYDEYQLWRYPMPRQVWDSNGKNTTEAHRRATNADLILDLVVVVVIANLGDAFKEYVKAPIGGDQFSWQDVWPRVGMALTVFINTFFLVYMRWQRICSFVNRWGQRDGIYEIFWAINISLFAIAGFAMVTAQKAPCFFGSTYFIAACIGLDANYILMYMYCTVAHGRRTRRWGPVIRFMTVDVLCFLLPPICVLSYLASVGTVCNAEFCQTDGGMDRAIRLFFVASFWDYLAHWLGYTAMAWLERRIPALHKCYGMNYPVNTENFVERVECLILMFVSVVQFPCCTCCQTRQARRFTVGMVMDGVGVLENAQSHFHQ